MTSTSRRSAGVAHLLAAAALALVATLAAAPLPARGAEPAPQLSIAVDDGHTSVAAGGKLGYTVTVTNLGTRTVRGLWVSQNVPAGAVFVSAGRHGTVRSGSVRWRVTLGAGQKTTMTTSMTVAARPPATLLRLASVACAAGSQTGRPLVCASDSDELPAGAAATAAQAKLQSGGSASPPGWGPYAASGVAAAVLLGAAAWLLRRRSQHPAG